MVCVPLEIPAKIVILTYTKFAVLLYNTEPERRGILHTLEKSNF